MLFKEFKEIIKALQEAHGLMEKYYDVFKIDTVYDPYNKLVTLLLNAIYEDYAILYILEEWLTGNKSPVIYKNEKTGEEITQELKTVHDLWVVMEQHRRVHKPKDVAKSEAEELKGYIIEE